MQLLVNVQHDEKKEKRSKYENPAKRPEERAIRVIRLSAPGRFLKIDLNVAYPFLFLKMRGILIQSAKFNKFRSPTW